MPRDRLERLCAMIFDGHPLGDYPTDIPGDRESEKRFKEMQWAAVAFIGCNADFEIRELRSLVPRHGKPTADFEGTLRGGDIVRIELAGIVFELEQRQREYFARIAGDALELLIGRREPIITEGTFMYRVYDPDGVRLDRHGQSQATAELARFIESNLRLRAEPTRLLLVDDADQYPTLTSLGVYVFCQKPKGATHIMWDPIRKPLDPDAALAEFDRVRTEKTTKFAGYSDDGSIAVWLLSNVESLEQTYIALSTVQALRYVDTIDPRPFSRVMVGCVTAGVIFAEPYRRPRYTSLSTTG